MRKIFGMTTGSLIPTVMILFLFLSAAITRGHCDNEKAVVKTICVAHRGGAAYAPENTLAALRNAIKLGADYHEIDVHLSKDGEVVVIHDDDLHRTTDGKGQVKDLTLEELKKLDAGSWFSEEFKGERIPTLAEVLDESKGKIGTVIEIKNGPNFYEGIEEKVINLVKERGMDDEVIIISFDHECLKKVNELAPNLILGPLYYANIIDSHKMAENCGGTYLSPGWQLVTKEEVERGHKKGLKFNLWTVNDRETMRKFIEMGVDAITTDKPDILTEEINDYYMDKLKNRD